MDTITGAAAIIGFVSCKCLYCGKQFNKKQYEINRGRGKYCSKICFFKSKKGKAPIPEGYWKGKKHTLEYKRKMSLSNKGKRLGRERWNWKGGITPLQRQVRSSFEYKNWRETIFKRDNYSCQICGARNGNGFDVVLNVDHYPKPFSIILKENKITSLEDAINCNELWDIKNNRTLCFYCHKNTDSYLTGRRGVLYYGFS